jgi:hypothetical protein
LKFAIFWDIAPCSIYMSSFLKQALAHYYTAFGTYWLAHEARRETVASQWGLRNIRSLALWSLHNCYPGYLVILPSHLLSLVSCSADFQP